MSLRVPKVDGASAAQTPLAPAAATGPRVRQQSMEERAGRTVHLMKILDATREMPATERARIQMQMLAYPQAWADDQWLDPPSDR